MKSVERKRAEALWQLLDDIDTLDDSCRDNDAEFRKQARAYFRARYEHLTSDGYVLYTPGMEPNASSSSARAVPMVFNSIPKPTSSLKTDRDDVDTSLDESGMQKDYLILSNEELAKGFKRPVRMTYKHARCQTTTTMAKKIAETFARDPKYYGGTYCAHCNSHFPVGEDGEFTWFDGGSKVGT